MKKQARHLLAKVPEATIFFWIIKILTTGMGETTSDFLAHALNPAVAVAMGGFGLLIVLALQFSVKKYIPWIYWLAVVMVSIFGTMAADVLHVGLGIPYIVSTAFYAIVLGLIFALWHRTEKTLSIHSIHTARREAFYWAAILATFALGTAAGDMTATTLGLGYFSSGILFAAIFAIPALLYWLFDINAIFAFWFAYIVTRPLGASFADWIGVSTNRGGLDFGTGQISLLLGIIILILVIYVSFTHEDVERHDVF
jgi:uncharacterized membrane-anchored protein